MTVVAFCAVFRICRDFYRKKLDENASELTMSSKINRQYCGIVMSIEVPGTRVL